MSVRQTSAAAYRNLVETGVLSPARRRIYAALYEHGPVTANELHQAMEREFDAGTQSNVGTRLGELRDMGVVVELEPRVCRITGMTNIVWDVTALADPIALRPRGSSAAEKAAAYRSLLIQVANWLGDIGQAKGALRVRECIAEIEGS